MEGTRGMEAVYHLAAVANVNDAMKAPVACIQANVLATSHVLEAARTNKVGRVILASTVWVYKAAPPADVDEQALFDVSKVGDLYTASKLACEMLCHSYWQLYKVPFTVLRYGIPYGPRMRDELVIPIFIRKALNGEPITIQGDGKQYRKFIYVEDLAEGNVAALAPQAENQTYVLDGAEQVSVVDIARSVGQLLGGAKIDFVPARPGDFQGHDTSAEKAAMELEWVVRTPFQEGLRKTLDWYLGSHPKPPARPALSHARAL